MRKFPEVSGAPGSAKGFAGGAAARRGTQRGLTLGVGTGLAIAVVDLMSSSLGRFGMNLGLMLAVAGLVVPVAALGDGLLATYAGLIRRVLPAERGRAARFAASALVALPFVAFALWVPASWVDEHFHRLRFDGRVTVVAALLATATAVMLASTLIQGVVRRHAERRLGTAVLGAFAAISAFVAGASYWADATLFEGDYEDFHYGASAAFVAATALALASVRALLPTFGPTAARPLLRAHAMSGSSCSPWRQSPLPSRRSTRSGVPGHWCTKSSS